MQANDKQIGGNHYKGGYEHWDFVVDTGQSYLQGCATKYISRWKKKNGLEDLKKSLHYVQKLNEMNRENKTTIFSVHQSNFREKFVKENEIDELEGDAIKAILMCQYEVAALMIKKLIREKQSEAQVRVDTTGQDHPFGYDAAGETE